METSHLDDAKGNFAVGDKEHASSPGSATFQPSSMVIVIYSDEAPLIEQNKGVFERSWNRADPVEQRIGEIEEDIISPKMKVIQDPTCIQRNFPRPDFPSKEEIPSSCPPLMRSIRAGTVLPCIRACLQDECRDAW